MNVEGEWEARPDVPVHPPLILLILKKPIMQDYEAGKMLL